VNEYCGFARCQFIALLALLAVIAFCVWGILTGTVPERHSWSADEYILESLQAEHENVVQIVSTERDAFNDLLVVVENLDGSRGMYCLDTATLWNDHYFECKRSTDE